MQIRKGSTFSQWDENSLKPKDYKIAGKDETLTIRLIAEEGKSDLSWGVVSEEGKRERKS